MPLIFASSFRHLLRHPAQLAVLLAGLALGVATISAIDLAIASARRAFSQSLQAVNGSATHQVVAGPQGIREELYVDLRIRGPMRELAPIVEGYVTLAGRSLQLLGVDPLAEAGFRDVRTQARDTLSVLGEWLTRPGALVLGRTTAEELELEVGERLEVDIAGRAYPAVLVALLEEERPGFESIVFTDIAQAQEWLGVAGRLSRIDVRLAEDVTASQLEALRRRLPADARLEAAEQRARELDDMTAAFMTNLQALSLLALLVGAFLVFSTVSFSALQRRRTFGVLRAQGVTGGEIAIVILIEAALLGIVGSSIGVLLGLRLSEMLLGLVSQTINDLYFVVAVRDVALDGFALAKAVVVGVGASLLAATLPALEAAHGPPQLALARSVLEARARQYAGRAGLVAMLMLAAAVALILFSGQSLLAGFVALFLVLMVGAALAPTLLRLASHVLAGALGRVSPVARLAIAGAGASLSRTGIAIAALSVAGAAALSVAVMISSFRGSLVDWLERTLRADLYITAPGPGFGRPERYIDPTLLARLLSFEGVVDHSISRRVQVQSPLGTLWLDAFQPARASYAGITLQDGDPRRVWRDFHEGAVLLSESLAYRRGLRAGSRITLATPQGDRSFTVGGVYRDYSSDRGSVLMARERYRSLWADERATSVGLYLAPSVSAGAAKARLLAIAAERQALLIRSNRDLRALSLAIFERTFAVTRVLYWLAAAVAALGLLSALLAHQLERARELATLRALGVTPTGVGALVETQTLFLGLAAGVLSIPLGLASAWVLIEVINRRAFGWQIDFAVAPAEIGASLWLAVAAALVAGLLPAWRSARAPVAAGIREE